MNKNELIYIGTILVVGLLTTWMGYGDVITAKSCLQYEVQSAIDSANSGDTVEVPAGNCTWVSNVSVPETVTLRGAGIEKTVITNNGSFYTITLNSNSRVTGFSINLTTGYEAGGFETQGANWRIDNCRVNNTSGNILDCVQAVHNGTPGRPKGLIDHCVFINSRVLVNGNRDFDEQCAIWTEKLQFGTDDTVYVEDCVFIATNLTTLPAVDANRAGSYVFRYNTVTDAHIEAHANKGPYRATRKWEIYGNTIIQKNLPIYMPFRLRAGTGVVFNNTIIGGFSNPNIGLDYPRSCESYGDSGQCNGTSLWDGNTPGENGYPCRDQIGRSNDNWLWTDKNPYSSQSLDPAYCWNNTNDDGDCVFVTIQCQESQDHIKEGRDFYNNNERPGYTPHEYPHPLIEAWDDNEVQPPKSLRIKD